MADKVRINGHTYDIQETLQPWLERKTVAERERKPFITQMNINRKFAAGLQHLDVNEKDGRVVHVKERAGIRMVTADILTQYILTVRGRIGSADYRSTFHVDQANELASGITKQMNSAYGWGWDHEWMGEKTVSSLVNHLVIDGTCALQVRYDRRFGEIIGEVPFRGGVPILDEEEARAYVADEYAEGRVVERKTLREGKVVWNLVPLENLLWPPGIEDPEDFPWDLIRRPVLVKDLKSRYGKLAEDVQEEAIESTAAMTSGWASDTSSDKKKHDYLPGRCMVYTGMLRPCVDYPEGMVVVFTADSAGEHLLDVRQILNFDDHPKGPRTGLHYFRWQAIPGRFPGRSFIEGGIGPQIVRNKRLTQIDAIIDRNMPKVYFEENSLALPKTGEPNELIPVRAGAPLPQTVTGVQPGVWMMQDVKLQEENAERALGVAPVTRGAAPQGISAYSALALLTENDALKLDPISQEIRLGMNEVSWDTMEAMRNWPSDKQIMIAGPESQLEVFEFEANEIPVRYIASPPRGGAIPRTQAAEFQKIDDIWLAAQGQLPLKWYIESKREGKAQDLPPSLVDQHSHKAELENVIMQTSAQAPPVAEYDDHARHAEIHRAAQVPLKAMADMGDGTARSAVAAFDKHLEEHLQQAQANSAQNPQQAPNNMPQEPTPAPPSPNDVGPPPGPPQAPQGPPSV